MRALSLLSLLCVLAGAPDARGQAGPRLADIWEAYQQLDYARAADSARAALDVFEGYSRTELAEIHVILGLIEFAENRPLEARTQFTAALSLNPATELDPLYASPRLQALFAEIRAERAQSPGRDADRAGTRYVVVEDRRVAAAMRSMALPGWGQLHKGERTKGRVLLGVWGTAVTAAAVTHTRRQQARRRYRAAVTTPEAVDRYAPFNRWHKRRTGVLYATAAIWAYSYVDALATRPESARGLHVAPALRDGRLHATARLRF